MQYKMILWDFDGTLADSLGCLLRIFNDMAPRYGFLPIEDPDTVRTLSVAAFLKTFRVPMLKMPFLIRKALAAQRSEMENIRLFPELPRVLESLRQGGCRLSILSSNDEDNIRTCLRANRVEDLFEAVVGYRRLFGKGRAMRRFLRKHGLAASDVVYIGDELRNVEAAREAGVDIAAVTWGYQDASVLQESQPKYLFAQPDDILQFLGPGRGSLRSLTPTP